MGPIRTGEHVTRRHRSRLAFCAAAGVAALASSGAAALDTLAKPPHKPDAAAVARHIIPLPRPRPRLTAAHQEPVTAQRHQEPVPVAQRREPLPTGSVHASLDAAEAPSEPLAPPPVTASAADLATAHDALALARRSKTSDATDLEQRISDPLARKIVEWAILRGDDNTANFSRYQAFLAANPNWPSTGMFRRRAEVMLWQEHADLATIRAFTGDKPLSGEGQASRSPARFSRRATAPAPSPCSATRGGPTSLQRKPRSRFSTSSATCSPGPTTRRAWSAGSMQTTSRAHCAPRTASAASSRRSPRYGPRSTRSRLPRKSLIEALPSSAHQDPGVMFSRIQMLRRADKYREAAQLMLAAPHDVALIYDPNEWWIERRLIARKLLDLNQAATAYKIVARRRAADQGELPGRARVHRRLDRAALPQGSRRRAPSTSPASTGITNPIAMARANYWRGRAAEAMNKPQDARAYYEQAARYNTAYYGQLARAKLGLHELALASAAAAGRREARRARPQRGRARRRDALRLNERDLVIPIVADLADRSPDMAMLAALAEVAARHDDARSALAVGKGALGRGQPFDHYAFPTFGLPRLCRDRTGGRAGGRLFDRTPGKRLQSEGRVERQCARPDAGDARSRALRRQEIQRRLRPGPAPQRQRLQHADRRRRARRRHRELQRLATSSLSPATMPAAAGSRNGSSATAIRATPRSTRSTGSSASRSPKRATTCSASSRTSRSTARVSAAARA